MPDTIKVLVLDGDPESLAQVVSQLAAAADLELVRLPTPNGHGGHDALEALPAVGPDVVLVDIGLPALEGLRTTAALTARYPWVSVIIMSTSEDRDHLRRAMLAGARHFLVKPFAEGELVESVREVYRLDAGRRAVHAAQLAPAAPAAGAAPAAEGPAPRKGRIYTFYSAKGGVGCTTIACNVAIALKQLTNKKVAIFDCGLLFGDVGVVLNVDPRHTIIDLLPHLAAGAPALEPEFLEHAMVTHSSGVKVLLAPESPEKADLVTPDHVHRILGALRDHFDHVVIDTWPTFEERILHVLDASDKIVVPTTLEMPAIKNSKLLMDVTTALSYPPEKIMMVLNRADSRGGIRVQDVEQILQRPFAAEVVSDGRLTTLSLNEGVPFIMTHPAAPIAVNITDLARRLTGQSAPQPQEARPGRAGGLLKAVFGT